MSEGRSRGRRRRLLAVLGTVFALGLALSLGHAGESGKASGRFVREQQRRTGELRAIALKLRDAILRKDIEALLRYETRGEQIGKYTYDGYAESKALLTDLQSWLFCQLFDTQCHLQLLKQQEGTPGSSPYRISVGEFFQNHPDLKIAIHFFGAKDPDLGLEGVLDLAQIAYVVPGTSLDRRFPDPLREDFPVEKWGKEYVDTCLQYTKKGWRYYATIFICPSD